MASKRSSSTSPGRTPSGSSSGSSSSSGLKGFLKAKATVEEEEQLQALSMLSSGLGIDAATQLGLKFQQNQYEQRRKALISPDAYARERAAAYTELTDSVNETYAAAAKKYTSSGLPPDMAKQFALQAARNESQIQQHSSNSRSRAAPTSSKSTPKRKSSRAWAVPPLAAPPLAAAAVN